MGFLNKFLGNKKESKEVTDYKTTVAEALNQYHSLMASESKVTQDFFDKI